MIPKIIHYCWFGKSEMSALELKCIESWKKFMPDYTLMLWNEENSPMNEAYMKTAYENKKWANLSNYTRLFALQKYGGWYFDTDIEVVSSPKFNKYKESCFVGIETKPHEKKCLVNNAVIAATPNHTFIHQCFEKIKQYDGLELANLTSPFLTTQELSKIGFKGKPGSYKDVRVFPAAIFYPLAWYQLFSKKLITKQTFCIHHYSISCLNINNFSSEDLRILIKKEGYYESEIERLLSGSITWVEYIKITGRFLLNKIKPF